MAAEGTEKDSWTKFSQPTWSEDRPAFCSHPALIQFLVAAALRWWWTPSLLRKLRCFLWRSVFNRAWARRCVSCYHLPQVPQLLFVTSSDGLFCILAPFFFLILETSPNQQTTNWSQSLSGCVGWEERKCFKLGRAEAPQKSDHTHSVKSALMLWVLFKQDYLKKNVMFLNRYRVSSLSLFPHASLQFGAKPWLLFTIQVC